MGIPHRRDVLQTLAGGLGALALAGCDDAGGSTTPPEPRVAVIGAGMAGLSAAWLLETEIPVDVFEARSVIGGNIRTATVDMGGEAVVVDMGAQYFNPRVYPTYARLLQRQGVLNAALSGPQVHGTPGTVTMTRIGEADPYFVSPSIPDRLWPVSEAWNQTGVSAFAALATGARALEVEDASWSLTVEDWLPTLGVDAEAQAEVLMPWIAAINSGRIDLTRDFSARAATVFLGRAIGDGPVEEVIYQTLPAGMGTILQTILSECSQVTVATELPARGLQRGTHGVEVLTDMGRHGPYSAVILALPGPMGGRLLDAVTGHDALRAALDDIQTFDATLALHRDPIYSPAEARMRSLLNAVRTETTCEVSMSMAVALPPLSDGSLVDLWKSWITHRAEAPADLITTEEYTHIHFSPQTLAAQARLAALQGDGGIYVAGGWTTPFDSQETALTSAMSVARAIAPTAPRLREMDAEA